MAPKAAAIWAVAYAVVHGWWAVGGAPRFAEPGESVFPGGWVPVAPALLAAVVGLLVDSGADRDPRSDARRVVAVLGWLSGGGMILYSLMFPVSVLGVVFGGRVSGVDWVTLLARGSGVIGGILIVAVAIAEQRRARQACPECGRSHGRSPERRTDPAPWWAFAGAYVVVAGCLARMGAEGLAGLMGEASVDSAGWGWWVFVGLLVLTGTLLPLALVYRWGRIWPRWVPPLAGRHVPRWLVLGPALFVGAGLAGYFGVAGMIAWATGDNVDGPLWYLALVFPGYTAWGLGLLVSSVSYFSLTRPECPLPQAERRHTIGALTASMG